MKCDSRMMVKMAVGLGIALAVAYFALPAAHALILASAPFLVVLICPVAMFFMMKGKQARACARRACGSRHGVRQARRATDRGVARQAGVGAAPHHYAGESTLHIGVGPGA